LNPRRPTPSGPKPPALCRLIEADHRTNYYSVTLNRIQREDLSPKTLIWTELMYQEFLLWLKDDNPDLSVKQYKSYKNRSAELIGKNLYYEQSKKNLLEPIASQAIQVFRG